MKGKAYIPLVVGLIVGVLAIKLTFDYVRKARGTAISGDYAMVVRAKATIPMAAEITNEMVEVVKAPKAFVPQDAFNKKEDVVGRVTNVIIPKDMAVVGNLLAPKGTTAGMEARIPAGYRAVAVKIDESSGVAFLVKPGSRVDVVAVMTTQSGRDGETVSKTILENVEVAAVGQELGTNADKGAVATKSVTLLLKPEEVPSLHLAAQKGKILLAMRNQVDMSSRPVAATTEKRLLGREDASSGSDKPGLFSKLFGGDQSAAAKSKSAAKLRPPAKPPVVLAAAPVIREWPVEMIAGSCKKNTELTQACFDGPTAVRRSVPNGVGSPKRSATFPREKPNSAPPAVEAPSADGDSDDAAETARTE